MNRPKTALVALVTFVGLALPSAASAAPVCTPGGTPPSDINTYLVLAKNHFETKGGNTPGSGNFLGGNVGVSNQNGTLRVGANGTFTMSANTALVGDDSVVGDDKVNVWDVYTNTTTNAITDPNVTIHSGPICIPGFPVVNNFPADPVFTPGSSPADDVTVNGTQNLAPGKYGKVVVGAGDTLVLDNGEYDLLSLKVSDGGVVTTKDGTVVNIAQDLSAEGTLGSSNLTRWFVRGDGVDPNSNVINFSVASSEVHGTFIAPTGEIALGHATKFTGRIWGDSMHSDFNINMTYAAPESISGTKFEDVNGNGQQDAGEPALAGFTFYVDVNDNGQFDQGEPSAVSAADGSWKIGPLYLTGTYNVREVGQSGYTCTFPAGNCLYPVTLADTGADHGGNTFGNHKQTPPCIPTAGQDANCQPIVTPKCVPTAGQDKNCKPIVETAKITGVKGGCSTVQKIRVSGSNIKKVTYKIDGKTVKTVKKKPYSYTLKTKNYKVGAHKLKVTTTFASGKTQTKTYTFQHCRAVAPRFTG